MTNSTMPHDESLNTFVGEVSEIYRLDAGDRLALLYKISVVVSETAATALASLPFKTTPPPLRVPQGVQDGPEFMRPEEVSTALGIHLSTLQGMRRRMEGPAFRKNVKAIFYRRVDVRAWVDGQATTPVPNGHADPSELRQVDKVLSRWITAARAL